MSLEARNAPCGIVLIRERFGAHIQGTTARIGLVVIVQAGRFAYLFHAGKCAAFTVGTLYVVPGRVMPER